MNAVDTNVFVYALDADEPVKQAKAVDLLDRLAKPPDQAVLLWQVASEFLNQLRTWENKGKIAAADVETAFRRVRNVFVLRLPSENVLQLSFDLRKRFRLSHWDSMILAACKDIGATTLYSEDMDAGTDYDGLTIVNPFA
jgi:predicted nucleic acid-binding protein